jgi:hypothetical protein
MAAVWEFAPRPAPSSVWTPASALYNFSDADEPRSTLSRASWKTLVMSSKPTTLPSSLQTGWSTESGEGETGRKKTHQMSEVSFYHELQSLSRASGIPRHHGIASHHLTDLGGVGVNTLSCNLSEHVRTTGRMFVFFRRTRYARSLAVKMPLSPSSSSTTRTQSVLFAAQS